MMNAPFFIELLRSPDCRSLIRELDISQLEQLREDLNEEIVRRRQRVQKALERKCPPLIFFGGNLKIGGCPSKPPEKSNESERITKLRAVVEDVRRLLYAKESTTNARELMDSATGEIDERFPPSPLDGYEQVELWHYPRYEDQKILL